MMWLVMTTIQMLSQTIKMIKEMQQGEFNSQNIPDTTVSKIYSKIPDDNGRIVNQMEWNNVQHKEFVFYTKPTPRKDNFGKIYCLQQECQPRIEALKNILIMLQHSIDYATTTDDKESLTLRPFINDCKKQVIVYLRKLRSISGRLMVLTLAEHFSLRHIKLVFQCFCSSNKQGRKQCLRKIPRMYTTPSGHKNYHLKQCICRIHRTNDDIQEVMRQIAAVKIQTSWRAALAKNNMLFAISLEQLSIYVAVILKQISSTASNNGKTNLYSLASLEDKLTLVTIAKIREKVFRKYYYVSLHHCLQYFVGAVREHLLQNAQHNND
ncbi:hypothetical protein Gasu2_31300 [Galdieria sulphuraria]|nr:hypothetical protein Gasu2_31300 [Galdieria sulphuraria]